MQSLHSYKWVDSSCGIPCNVLEKRQSDQELELKKLGEPKECRKERQYSNNRLGEGPNQLKKLFLETDITFIWNVTNEIRHDAISEIEGKHLALLDKQGGRPLETIESHVDRLDQLLNQIVDIEESKVGVEKLHNPCFDNLNKHVSDEQFSQLNDFFTGFSYANNYNYIQPKISHSNEVLSSKDLELLEADFLKDDFLPMDVSIKPKPTNGLVRDIREGFSEKLTNQSNDISSPGKQNHVPQSDIEISSALKSKIPMDDFLGENFPEGFSQEDIFNTTSSHTKNGADFVDGMQYDQKPLMNLSQSSNREIDLFTDSDDEIFVNIKLDDKSPDMPKKAFSNEENSSNEAHKATNLASHTFSEEPGPKVLESCEQSPSLMRKELYIDHLRINRPNDLRLVNSGGPHEEVKEYIELQRKRKPTSTVVSTSKRKANVSIDIRQEGGIHDELGQRDLDEADMFQMPLVGTKPEGHPQDKRQKLEKRCDVSSTKDNVPAESAQLNQIEDDVWMSQLVDDSFIYDDHPDDMQTNDRKLFGNPFNRGGSKIISFAGQKLLKSHSFQLNMDQRSTKKKNLTVASKADDDDADCTSSSSDPKPDEREVPGRTQAIKKTRSCSSHSEDNQPRSKRTKYTPWGNFEETIDSDEGDDLQEFQRKIRLLLPELN